MVLVSDAAAVWRGRCLTLLAFLASDGPGELAAGAASGVGAFVHVGFHLPFSRACACGLVGVVVHVFLGGVFTVLRLAGRSRRVGRRLLVVQCQGLLGLDVDNAKAGGPWRLWRGLVSGSCRCLEAPGWAAHLCGLRLGYVYQT